VRPFPSPNKGTIIFAMATNKQSNKYNHLSQPAKILDFHKAGFITKQEIEALTKRFVERSSQEKLHKIMIITGKGLHSQNGQAVIKPIVENILLHNEYVKTYSWAPRQRGGDGAFEINLF
jgi:DNA-nicking Smr family endonuclease